MRSASWPRGTASRGAASSQSMMSTSLPPIRSRRSRVTPSAAAWAGLRMSAACSISSPTKVLLRSSGQPLRMACASAHLASMSKCKFPQRPISSRLSRPSTPRSSTTKPSSTAPKPPWTNSRPANAQPRPASSAVSKLSRYFGRSPDKLGVGGRSHFPSASCLDCYFMANVMVPA